MKIVLVVYDGVLNDECEAFRSVLGLIDAAEVIVTGARGGSYSGPGGHQAVDTTFDQVTTPDVVVVPGGLGCERAADDPDLRRFLHRMERTATYVAGSSTGSVVLAAAGLLHGEPAATHWLATDLLKRYGSESADRRLVVSGNVITAEGAISAVDAAFTLVHRLVGPGAIEPIRDELLRRGEPLLREPRWWDPLIDQLRDMFRRPSEPTEGGPSTPEDDGHFTRPVDDGGVTPGSVMVELMPNDEMRRRVRRNARRAEGKR